MKNLVFKTTTVFLFAVITFLLLGCEPKLIDVHQVSPTLKTVTVDSSIFELMEHGIALKFDSLNTLAQYVCSNIEVPKYLNQLNRNEVYASNISLEVNASLQAYGFSGSMGKKDVLIIAYLTKFKDYNCEGQTKRVQVGLKLYVHASDLKVKVSSPSLGTIAAATELGLAKAEYKFETFGLDIDDFYTRLPSAQFTVDTYAKVISAYDNIVHSLKDSTAIDPIITDLPK